MGMRMKETVMPVEVRRKALRRPRPSIRKTESTEQMGYSAPPQAAMR
jgi:hypothetical protein